MIILIEALNMTKRKFNGKYFTAYGEFYGKKQAEKAKEKYKKKGWYVRITRGAYIGSYTVWVRKTK